MVLGFNEFPIIASALNSEDHEHRYPIVHAVLRCKFDEEKGTKSYYIKFSPLYATEDAEKVDRFKKELMIFIKENTNLDVPFEYNEELVTVFKSPFPGSKWAIIPKIDKIDETISA
jgi:hypothetical protein